jgi:hypothetical protein
MMDKVKKHYSSKCKTPSPEPFIIDHHYIKCDHFDACCMFTEKSTHFSSGRGYSKFLSVIFISSTK